MARTKTKTKRKTAAAVVEREEIDARIDSLPDIVFVIDDDGTILDCRGGDAGDLVAPRDRLIGKRITDYPIGSVGSQFETAMETVRDKNKPVSIVYTLPCDSGLAHFEARLVRSDDKRFVAVVRNTTQQAVAEWVMRRSGEEYREMLHAADAAILLLDPTTGTVIECNSSAAALYRFDRDDLIDTPLEDLFVDSDDIPDLPAIAQGDEPCKVEFPHRINNEGIILMEMSLSPVVFRGERVVLGVSREIDPAHGEEQEVSSMLSMLKATFDATADGILVLDPDGKFVTSNRLFGEMWNIPADLLEAGQEHNAVKAAMEQVEDPGAALLKIEEIQSSAQARSSNIVKFRRVQVEERIRHHAYHDSLTGLPNRALFQDRMSRDLGQAKRAKTNTALLLMDLDRFKTINDTLGHAAGDKLLIEVAERLQSRRREGDTIARLGGDEFVMVVSQLRHKEDVAIVAEQILDVLKAPIQIKEFDLHVSASIGIAIYPDDGDDHASLLKSADVALYRAKELGRNNFQIFEPKLNQRAMERLVLEKDLRRAIHDGEFVLQYQPQYDLNTGQMSGVEALVRWQQGDAIVPPDKFIPVAEECGLIVPLGQWVLEEAARQCAKFNRHRREPLRLCVNVSALQIQRPNFANEVSEMLRASGVPLHQLVVELTESALMQNPEQGSWAMAQLRQMGIGIAMDDFGTGHSSLNYVSLLPISIIKIDKSFVTNCSIRKPDALILQAIVTMGHALGLKVLAEGVETHEQVRILREHGCDEVQGYLYSKPVSAEQLIGMLRKSDKSV
jgi:diguanylate cyclase (GGDEF)-like protein